MNRLADLIADMQTLDGRFDGALAALDDPDSKMNGGDVAAIGRERRALGGLIRSLDPKFDLASELRRDYDRLAEALGMVSGSSAAVVVRERRLVGELVERLETPKVVPKVDELAARRQSEAGPARPPSRRRQSG